MGRWARIRDTRPPTPTRLASNRPLALHRDARARTRVRPVVPHRPMLGAAIVPERDRVLGPTETALEQRVLGVLIEIVKDRVALVAREADDMTGEAAVDVERFAARHRMRANDRMLGARIGRLVGDSGIGIEAAIDRLAVVQGGEACE